MSATELFILFGGIGLFLYGMSIMSSGLRSACGERLQLMLAKATKNTPMSVLAGVGVTVLVQSSSATDMMVIGFVSSGLMTLLQAIGVIMGANIGTTITAQITAFNIGMVAPLILFIGAVMCLFLKHKTARDIGRVVLGFGMLFEGIALMKGAIAPLAETPGFRRFIDSLENPALLILFGVAFTALLQSSSSSTVIFQAFAIEGLINYNDAVFLIIGAAIGAVTPNLLASLTSNRAGKRCALLNLLFNLMRAALVLLIIGLFPGALRLIQSFSPDDVGRQIANTHTLSALVSVLCLVPFAKYIVKLSEKLIPITEQEKRRSEEKQLIYLNQPNISSIPLVMTLGLARREISRMGHISIDNLKLSLEGLFEGNAEKMRQVLETEQTVDYLTENIDAKLVELRTTNMTPKYMTMLYHMIQIVDDLERVSDHAENIAEYTEKLLDKKAVLSDVAIKELQELAHATMDSMYEALEIFEFEKYEQIAEMLALEEYVDEITERITQNHVERLMNEKCDPNGGVIFTDMAIDLERCSDHAVRIATALSETPM